MRNPVNVAVIGAGNWGRKVLAEYLQLARDNPDANLALVCDLQDQNLKSCVENFDLPEEKLVSDYKQAISSDNVDAVHICTPNETHYEIGKEALMLGKHVLLEKPMALKAKQAWELVSLAESKHLCLQVGHIFRFNNALKLIRDLVSRKYFGELYYLKLEWTTLMPSPFNRDIIFDLGPHPIDIVNYLLGEWPRKVACAAKAYRRKLLEELAYITMEFNEKLIVHIELSWLEPGKVRQLNIIGSERSATVDCLNQSVMIHENDGKKSFNLDVVANNTILDEVDHFVASILDGETNEKYAINHGSVGAKNVAVLESLKKSLFQEKTVETD